MDRQAQNAQMSANMKQLELDQRMVNIEAKLDMLIKMLETAKKGK